MEKVITVKIPNEIWVNDFSENKTANFTYNGPDTVWAIIEKDNQVNSYAESQPSLEENRTSIEINIPTASDDKVMAATLLVSATQPHTYTYVSETNHDGSTYEKISNPQLKDYYTLRYNPSLGFELVLIQKDTTVPTEITAKERKAYIEKYANAYEFSSTDTAKINEYLTAINTYLESVRTAYPWKYVEINKNEVPKIPVALVQLFATLPAL